MKSEVITCSVCGCKFSDTSFHVTTSRGLVICECCIFEAMEQRRGESS